VPGLDSAAWAAAYDCASETMACNRMAEDVAEGIEAYIPKRPPIWKGR
jgi:hypothetical protein